MYRPLCPCPRCARHVRATERACPFCRAAMPDDFARRARPAVKGRWTRNAALALGTSLALAGCGSTASGSDAGVDAPTADAPAADAPAIDTPAVDASAPDVFRDAPSDEGTVVALYGDPPPPMDAGRDVVEDEGGSVFLYGAPPPPDFPVDGG